MKHTAVLSGLLALMLLFILPILAQQDNSKSATKKKKKSEPVKSKVVLVSFKNDVFPIIKKNCLPCHAEEQMNKSELNLDSYDLLIAGGEHGSPVRSGKADSSIIIQKLGPNPPFGKPMPLKAKEPLSNQDVKVITDWINQGAKKN